MGRGREGSGYVGSAFPYRLVSWFCGYFFGEVGNTLGFALPTWGDCGANEGGMEKGTPGTAPCSEGAAREGSGCKGSGWGHRNEGESGSEMASEDSGCEEMGYGVSEGDSRCYRHYDGLTERGKASQRMTRHHSLARVSKDFAQSWGTDDGVERDCDTSLEQLCRPCWRQNFVGGVSLVS